MSIAQCVLIIAFAGPIIKIALCAFTVVILIKWFT